jgi:DNA modification methylase
VVERQVGRGTSSRLFGRKTEELGRQLKALAEAVPPGTPAPILRQADARALPGHDATVDLIITSPPYVGTYDYSSHQDRRFDWLEEDSSYARAHEIGARRGSQDPRRAWIEDEQAMLLEMARVLKPGGRAFLVVGDGLLAGEPYLVDREIGRSAEEAGLRLMAVASQDRPHFNRSWERAYGRRPRREHVIALRRGGN